MDKAILNVKTDRTLKKEAQRVAKRLGLPLGTIVNHYLRQLVRERRVLFSLGPTPNRKTWNLMRKASWDYQKGKNIAGPFKTAEEAVGWLDSNDI